MTVSLALWIGCAPPGGSAVVVTATGAASPLVPTVLTVTVDGPAGVAWVEYGRDGAFDLRTPDQPSASRHRIAVLGLKAGQTYAWRAVIVDAEGERHVSATGAFDAPPPPPELLDVDVTVSEPEAALRYALTSVIRPAETTPPGHSFAAILDRDGDWVWWVRSDDAVIVTPELGADGASIVFAQYAFDKSVDTGNLVRTSLDGQTRTQTRLKLGHHDVVQHDDGSIAFLSTSFERLELGGVETLFASDVIALGHEGMTDADAPALVYDQLQDFPLEPELTCDHIRNPTPIRGEELGREWTHGNSLVYVAEEDAYYLNQKFTDWLLKIDRSTGELLWIMNGRGGDFRQPDGAPVWADIGATSLWSHGHLSEIWPGGGLVFDNGDHRRPPVSRAVEVAWDESTMTAEVVWAFPHPAGGATPALGDVRRMSNDDVLVTWAGLGTITEVTRDHRIVWQGELPADQLVGRLVPIDDLYALVP